MAAFRLILLTEQIATAGNGIAEIGCLILSSEVNVGFETNPSSAKTNI